MFNIAINKLYNTYFMSIDIHLFIYLTIYFIQAINLMSHQHKKMMLKINLYVIYLFYTVFIIRSYLYIITYIYN